MVTINVLASIGDILFCEPIYRHFWKRDGVKPNVIIRDHLMYLQEYILSANFIPASQWSGDIDDAVMTSEYIPLRFANPIYRGLHKHDWSDLENCMLDKYRLLDLDENLWRTIDINFNGQKAVELAKIVYTDFQKHNFHLVNQHSQAGDIEIPIVASCENAVFMYDAPGYNVIDWCVLIAAAAENHHVSTSTFFIMQAIANKSVAKENDGVTLIWNAPVCIYPRPNEDGLRGISQLIPTFNCIKVYETQSN